MKVIIIRPTKKLRKIGEVVQVKKGYARNYLIPNGMAIRSTEENLSKFAEIRKDLDIKYQNNHDQAVQILHKINEATLTFISQSLEDGKLFGSISAKQIVKKLHHEHNVEIKSEQVDLEVPIKSIGAYLVKIVLHNDVVVSVFVNVARTDSEASNQINNFKTSLDTQNQEISKIEEVR
jgi:large subunit ribosomal protein L9